MARLREGRANTARGAAHFLRETVGRVRYAGVQGQLTVRAGSGFYAHAVVAICRRIDVRYSITIRQHNSLRDLIEAIPEEAPAVRSRRPRRRHRAEPSRPYVRGDLTIEYPQRRVTVAGRTVALTIIEYRMLVDLSANAGRPLTHERLLQRVWGPDKGQDSAPVRNIVRRLRRKLGDDPGNPGYIFAEPRVGYRMAVGEHERSSLSSPGTAAPGADDVV